MLVVMMVMLMAMMMVVLKKMIVNCSAISPVGKEQDHTAQGGNFYFILQSFFKEFDYKIFLIS